MIETVINVIGYFFGFCGSGLWSSDEHKSWESLSKGSGIGFMARLQSCYHPAAERGIVWKGEKH